MSVDKQTASRRSRATSATESAKRFGVKLQGAAREGVAIVLLAACVFLLLALFSYAGSDPGWSRSGPETQVANWMGPVGAWLADVLYSLFGVSALWWPGMLGFAAWRLLRARQVSLTWDATLLAVRGGGLILLLLGTTTLGALHFYRPEGPLPYSTGGILGEGLVGALLPMVGVGGTGLLASAALLCGVPLFTGISWLSVMDELGRGAIRLWGGIARRFAFTRDEALAPEEAPAAPEASGQGPSPSSRPAWWRRLVPGRPTASREPEADGERRREPGFGDDGDTAIPWEVPERTPSAKQPGAAYAEHAAAARREPSHAAAEAAPAPSGAAREPSRGAVGATGTAPDAPATQGPVTPRRAPESVPEPVLPDDDDPVPPRDAPVLRARGDEGAPDTRRPAEPAATSRPEPSPAPSPSREASRREPALTESQWVDGDGTDDDEPRLSWDEPAVAEEAEAPEPVRPPASREPASAGLPPAALQPPEPEQAPGEEEDDETPRLAGADQAREAAEEEGMRLWTVEHLQNQRPVLDELPEPDGTLPSLRLLTPPSPQKQNFSGEQLAEMAELLEVRLREYGVKAEVVETWPGPVITRFEIKPAAGVKVSKISNLAKDLARSLMVKSVRVVEVIPGRPTVGIEIPNPHRAMIRLREVIDSDRYQQADSALTLALGQDIGGGPVVANLGKMPHLLVAGTTGSGKSVGVNAMLISMLLKATPEELRLIMVDPKMLELSVYDGIPHLLAPVVTDMKEAANALRWCVAEMERRYKLMAAMGVRNIAGFNAKLDEAEQAGAQVADPLWEPQPWEMHQTPPVLEKLPYIVVVIDEFADMFMIVGKKVEELIARLAQKARAAGIHLILATQRPSVDVVTGLIKANVPTRMAFQVSSRVDSRTILDQGGAENLLGHGDMLYLPAGSGMPTRVHGAFVDDDEVHRVVEDWKRRGEPEYIEEILSGGVSAEALTGLEGEGGGDDDAEQDALYDEAVAYVTESRRASISAVQRRFKIGYNRAARLVEAMEMAGVVSTMGTNGAREVLAPPPVGE
ncbi:DNA translocase FtsK 4TM domain-containing protein [Halomonas sp.]|uniref:DNA translocase FtsK n=1 Tax=Halomonas sp. TaxID=1486246 RepID=UPI00261D128A|nr:DNA translocase FtsK 4TM domain-containing protein [Halomonas sp.]